MKTRTAVGVLISGSGTNLAALIREEKENDYPPEHDLAVHEATLLASGYSVSP